MVPANTCKIPRVPHYSGAKPAFENFRVRDYHALWCAFPHNSANLLVPLCLVPRPRWSKPHRFRLVRFRSPLLTESLLFSLPRGTEMVHFPRFALPSYGFRRQYMSSAHVGSPIRKSTDQRMLAPHRSLSQLATSFIASKCQGIHRVPLVA